MPWLAHLSYWRRTRAGDLQNVPLYFAGVQARGDEYNSPVSIVIDVGRRFVIEPFEVENTGQILDALVLTGEGEHQWQRYRPETLVRVAALEKYGMSLLYDERDIEERRMVDLDFQEIG